MSLEARFWAKVAKGDGCWEWTGYLMPNGYGKVYAHGGAQLAHRVSWELAHGPAGEMCVCHHCDNPRCVRPDHLFLGTMRDNMQDCSSKGRARGLGRPGEAGTAAKLTDDAVIQIRRMRAAGATNRSMARQFGVTPTAIWHVVHRRTWTHLP